MDLEMGARFDQIPPVIQSRLFDDAASVWRDRGIAVEHRVGEAAAVTLSLSASKRGAQASRVVGQLPSIVQWMTGRGEVGLSGDFTQPPKWL
jgi:hypothetical protein